LRYWPFWGDANPYASGGKGQVLAGDSARAGRHNGAKRADLGEADLSVIGHCRMAATSASICRSRHGIQSFKHGRE